MKPIIEIDGSTTLYKCPKCKQLLLYTRNMGMSGKKTNYCPNCGQRLDWNGVVLDVYWSN